MFGEHFVVKPHTPAIVAAVSSYTDCTVDVSNADWSYGLVIEDNRPAVKGYKPEKAEEMLQAIQLVLNHFRFDTKKQGIKMTFGGDLCAVSGIGASAAQCVALARALNEKMGLNMSEDDINAAAYEGEKGYHGTPSGIDNTASTFGGLLAYQRTEGAPRFDKIPTKKPCRVIFASTGITSSTTKVVGDVKAKREANPEWYKKLETQYMEIYKRAEKAINNGDWKTVAELANENHKLLQELTVSCKELDDLVKAAIDAGALGAKMSGTGRGGLMLAISPDDDKIENAIFESLSKIAPNVWRATFGA